MVRRNVPDAMEPAAVKNSKRGSYILEASLVLPIIILVTITVVLIIMFFYSQMTEQSRMHRALRQEAGLLTEKTTYFQTVDFEGSLSSSKSLTGGKVTGEKELSMVHRGILSALGRCQLKGSCYATDGPKYVRYCNLVKGVKDE
ncbi:MAG: hypothetical protein Q4C25_01930 [Bacillota bacterium]|nr:hypothetical protein [Bacillota bacterium]